VSIELNRDNYEAETGGAGGAVLVDFWGPLCKPCLALTPGIEQIETDYSGKLTVGKVDATHNRLLCARLRVMSLPTFILYRDGTEKARLTGEELKINEIRAAVEEVVGKSRR
jgi:thioredoxin 1